MTATSGGEAIVSGLVAHGVDTVFGLPGAQIYGLFDAFQLGTAPREALAKHAHFIVAQLAELTPAMIATWIESKK
jgi:thiamine pyrophosphate-dependent acetolactate synthase large subunit-like protein